MPQNIFDIEARFFDGATGLRLQASPDDVLSIAWEVVEAGGLSTIAVELARPFDDLNWDVQGGDIIEVWALGTGETAPRARGRVGQYEKVLDLKEHYLLTGYGLMEDQNHVLIDRIVLHPGGRDLSLFVAQIADDYAARRPGLQFLRDIQTVGVALERMEQANSTARQSMDQVIAQAGGNAVWGWDIEPTTGLDRFYLRPKTSTVAHQWYVGGSVKVINAPQELQGIVNAIKIQGGPAKYPQLLTNPSFEVPELPSEASGDILTDGGFELGIGWNYINGASRNTQGGGGHPHYITGHTGKYYALVDHPNEEVWQEAPVTPLTMTYRASLFCARENGADAATGRLIVEGRDGSGAVLETYTLPLAPASTAWTGGQGDTVLSGDSLVLSVTFQAATITHARVRIVCDTGNSTQGLLIDDVTFADASGVGSLGWFADARDGKTVASQFPSLDWACPAAGWEGVYGVRAHVTPTSAWNAVIEPYPGLNGKDAGYHAKVTSRQSLREGVRVRMSPGLNAAAGQARLEYVEWAGDGHQTQRVNGAGTAIPNDGTWVYLHQDLSVHADGVTATVGITFGLAGTYDVDGFSLRDTAAGDDFLRGTQFERYVTAESVCTTGSAAYNSFSTYGRQEAAVGNSAIVTWNADAQGWAKAYFSRNAVPLERPRLDLTHEPAQTPLPGDGTQVRVSGLAQGPYGGADLQDWCAKASYSWRSPALSVSLDLSNERPTWAKLLSNLKSGGGGSASTIAAVSRGEGGGGSVSTPPGISVTDGTTTVSAGTVKFIGGTVTQDAAAGQADVTIPAADHKVIVSGSDGAPDYLFAKLAAGLGIALANNGGAVGIAAIPPGAGWGIQGQDLDDGGTGGFAPSALVPTWETLWPSADGNLSFTSVLGGPLQPVAWLQRAVLATRLKVATAKTITISVYADNHCSVYLNSVQVGVIANAVNSYPLGTITYSLPLLAGWNDLQLCYGNGSPGDSYALEVSGWVSGAAVSLASLVDRMSGVLPPLPPRVLTIYIPGALAVGADPMEITLPSDFSGRTLKRIGARLGTAGSTATTFTAQVATALGAFVAAQTSDTITLAASTNEAADVTAFTAGLTGSGGNAVRLNLTAIGTGAADLTVRLEW